MINLKPEESLILLSADICPDKTGLISLDRCLEQVTDWDYVCKLLIERAAAPLFLNQLPKLKKSHLIPGDILYKLKQASLNIRIRNTILSAHFTKIRNCFNQEHIPIVAMKGVFLSEWMYGDIGLRQFSDLDLLVPTDCYQKSLDLLDSMGYRPEYLQCSEYIAKHAPSAHGAPMCKNGVSVEIHRNIHASNESYCVPLERLWMEAVPVRIHGVDTLAFRPEDLLLHLCLHLDKHFRSGRFQFTCLYDLVNMIHHKGHLIDWHLFENRCREAGAENNAYKYLSLVSEFMGVRLPEMAAALASGKSTPDDLQKTQHILRNGGERNCVEGVFRTLRYFEKKADKLHYLFDMVFPSRAFMIKRYRLNSSVQLILYYPYRFTKAVSKVFTR